ncbi:MAG TPA: peptidoglycan recognition family protein [Armatimonadota bacterium]|jgi:hypothetical protein
MPNEQQLGGDEFAQYLKGAQVARGVAEVIVHHTESPTAAQYRGISTVAAVRRYHMEVRGWSDNGYHLMIGPGGEIFRCRPLERAGGHCLGHNEHSVGVSFIANFDEEDPAGYAGWRTGQMVVAAVLQRFGLGVDRLHFHREFADKTCPGTKLDLVSFRAQVQAILDGERDGATRVVLLPGSNLIPCRARVEGDVTRVDLRPLAEALGFEAVDHLREEGKVYLRKR